MFSQSNKTNLLRCFGCPHTCKLNIRKQILRESDEHLGFIGGSACSYIPQINSKDITEFTDIDNIHFSNTACSSYKEACALLREKILPACDNYNNQR